MQALVLAPGPLEAGLVAEVRALHDASLPAVGAALGGRRGGIAPGRGALLGRYRPINPRTPVMRAVFWGRLTSCLSRVCEDLRAHSKRGERMASDGARPLHAALDRGFDKSRSIDCCRRYDDHLAKN